MKSALATAAVLALAACGSREPVMAKLVDSRPGSSMTGVTNTTCTYRYSDVRGDHEVKKSLAKEATCPPSIKVER
jgi:ABC-type glycerol-3-phosphate transport system substrate-binding protein